MSKCGDGCGAKAADGAMPAYRRVLWLVVALNGGMFLIGAVVAVLGRSVSVQSDVLDFLGDSVATGMGLILAGRSPATRAKASLWQGLALGALSLFVLGGAFYRAFAGVMPEALGMGVYGALGLIVNLGSALLLIKHRNGDANVRAVWLYSRNDAIGNIGVLLAAGAVALLGRRWPDVAVGVAIAGLFLHSAYEIIRQSRRELAASQLSQSGTTQAASD
jgi:Co/Zn/Cd efflux system component